MMMRRAASVGCVAMVAILAAGAALQESKFGGDVLSGRSLFVEKGCVRCHAVLGGGGKIGPDLAEVGKGKTFFDTLGLLWSHSPRMVKAAEEQGAEWPTIAPREMDDLLAYLYYLNYFDKPGDYVRGEKTFAQKGCIKCHRVGKIGGDVGPSLDPYGEQASPVAMVANMWNHGPNMALRMERLSIPKPVLEGTDVSDLLAFIRGATATSGARREYIAPGNPVKGRKLFEEAGCSHCHAVRGIGGGKGDGSVGPDLAESDLHRGVSELAGIMWNHGPIMWDLMKRLDMEIITFEPEDMAHIIAYLYFINYYSEGGDAEAGKKVFSEKGCATCHPVGGAAGGTGPDLVKSRSIRRPARFASALWNHAPEMVKVVEKEVLPWPEFRGSEMGDLHAYLVELQEKAEEE